AAPSIPLSSDWQLVDDPEPVVSAPRERASEAAAPRIEFDFELEPLEASAPVAVARDRGFEEMRLDGPAANNAEPQE
ncbi:MAG TPA: hypothetical protein VJ722_04395, partial [Rhodanobacteraceae bacterium]|nr:hypothetical protein [Rhodanobacteraceae bacterium]